MNKFWLKITSLKFNNLPYTKNLFMIIISFVFLTSTIVGFEYYFKDKIYPNVTINGINLGGKNPDEAKKILIKNISLPKTITLVNSDKSYKLSLSDINLFYDIDKTINNALNISRDEFPLINIKKKFLLIFKGTDINLVYSYDLDKLDEYLEIISQEVLNEPLYPKITTEGKEITIVNGAPGDILNKNLLLSILNTKFSRADFSDTILPLEIVDPSLTSDESKFLRKRAEKYLGKEIILTNEYQKFEINEKTILSFLDYHTFYNRQVIEKYLGDEIINKVERPPQNAVLHFDNNKVTEFLPAKDGLIVEKTLLVDQIVEKLKLIEENNSELLTIAIPVQKTAPEITLNEVNNLGIKELLGRGTSKFKGSIPGRIHNISLASSKFNGVLIPPGETLSFNNTLGDVSTFTGYKQAYIIKDGRTILGDGGGVCQVSTTLFRAILNAGLPIIERRAHSYRVSYYEQDSPPGLDATVFSPTTDFKFTNDTPGHLLIQTEFNPTEFSLIFEIYGTSDGRIAHITKPVITSSIAPPEDLYIDDPNLKSGIIKQIEHKSWGAKVIFDYTVEKDGHLISSKTFTSNYQPWQAVFLRGTGE